MYSQVQDFYLYIASEKGLSANTQIAYKQDVERFYNYLLDIGLDDFKKVNQEKLLDFLDRIKKQGYASSSIARYLMTIKVFFRFLKREGDLQTNITLYLKSPKIWQIVPEVLSSSEITRLLKSLI